MDEKTSKTLKTCINCKNIENKYGLMDQEHIVHCGANISNLAIDNPKGKQAKQKSTNYYNAMCRGVKCKTHDRYIVCA